jgi:L-malate glycosyltransferase
LRIDQFLPSFAPSDAIGNHALQTRRALRQAGFESDIWAEEIHGGVRHEARPYLEYASGGRSRADALLYHASTHSAMADFIGSRPEPVLIDYHNITPSRFFARWEPRVAAAMDEARVELRGLAAVTELAVADSPYNEAELVEIGYRRTAVCPLLVDFDAFDAPPDPRAMTRIERRRAKGGSRWLFVGRVSPNKCQHELIGAFAAYRRLFDPRAHLTLVGGMTSRLYYRALYRLVAELDLNGSVEIVDSVPFGDLLAYYRTADAFVCLSEHEGFCIPVMEAMHLGVPVIAYAAAALPDTVAGGGILLADKDPLVVACAVERILSDVKLRDGLVDSGRIRVEEFTLARTSKSMVETLGDFLRESRATGG